MPNYNSRIDVNLGSKASIAQAEARITGLEGRVKKALRNALYEIGEKMHK